MKSGFSNSLIPQPSAPSAWEQKILEQESNTVQSGSYERHDYRPIKFVRERSYKKLRISKPESEKLVVRIVAAKTDTRETIEKDGKKVKNERFGKIMYETVESVEVYEAKPSEVLAAIMDGLNRASAKK